MKHRAIKILALSIILCAEVVHGAELVGQIEIQGVSSSRRLKDAMEGAIVYFEPEKPVTSKPSPKTLEMTTRKIAFEPRVMAINPGSTIRFPNEDTILHNVFSVSPSNIFDLGFYRRGDGKAWTFDKPGLVRVFCNVHYSMTAHVLVLKTPFFIRPDEDGKFRLQGLPAGKGTLRIWQDKARPWSMEVDTSTREPVIASLRMSRRRVVPHKNKHGKAYKRGGRDDNYR